MKLPRIVHAVFLISTFGIAIEGKGFPWEEDFRTKRDTRLTIVNSNKKSEVKQLIKLTQTDVDVCLDESETAVELKNCLNIVIIDKIEIN